MNWLVNIMWWLCFIMVSIGVQSLIPTLDALVVGLLILLQEKDYKNMLWLLPFFILLQEGLGTRVFGWTIVWYIATVALFRLGQWFFEAENFFVVFLLSACMGLTYYGLAWLFAPLQELVFNEQSVMDSSLVQALFVPFAWLICVFLRPKVQKNEE